MSKIPSFRHKIAKIRSSIKNEGIFAYTSRLYNLGMYRFYLRRWLYKKELQRLTVSVNGLSLALPSRCAGIKEELILYGIHEPLASSCYSNLLKPKDIIFDIGTNIGYYMSVADKALNGECSIYGFEADPELAELARTNGKKLRAQCNVEHLAVAEHTGTTIFFVSEVSNWGTLRARDDLRLSNKVEVRCTSLDNYAKTSNTNPDVIRMDIEGGEILALRGGRRVLSRTRLLFMELHCAFLADSEIEEICDILEDAELQHVIWFNRYYDWPWSKRSAAKRTCRVASIKEFRQAAKSKDWPVLSVFASRIKSDFTDC